MIYDSVVARSWKRTLISGRPLWTWPMKQFKIGTYDASVYKYDECIKSSLHFDPFKSLIHCAFSNNTHWVRALQCTPSALSVIMNYFIVVVKKPTLRFFFQFVYCLWTLLSLDKFFWPQVRDFAVVVQGVPG